MLRHYSKARSAASGSVNGDISQNLKTPSLSVYEKRAQELSKAVEESQKNADHLTEELREKRKQEVEMQEELERLKDSLKSEKQNMVEVICDRDKLRSLCDEKDIALQVALSEKRRIEARFASMDMQGHSSVENDGRGDLLRPSTRAVARLNEELKLHKEQLHAAEETAKRLSNEKLLLEQRIMRTDKKSEEMEILETNFEQERRTLKIRVSELEKKLERVTQDLAVMESTLEIKNAELDALQNSLKELEELREMKEDIDRKNEQTAAILKRQGAAIFRRTIVLLELYDNSLSHLLQR